VPAWVAVEALGIPALTPFVLIAVLRMLAGRGMVAPETANSASTVLLVAFVVIVIVRLPLLVYTLTSDRRITLDDRTLHVPVISPWQLRPWNIAVADLAEVSSDGKRAGTTRLILRGRRTRKLPSTTLRDVRALVSALERRIAPD
jgi:hypothetical protein